MLNDWYRSKAKEVLQALLDEVMVKAPQFHGKIRAMQVKAMPKRWGSCTPGGTITLNSELVKAPKACIEYVILHELCHLTHPNHTKQFYNLLTSLMPDWPKWKDRLERSMA